MSFALKGVGQLKHIEKIAIAPLPLILKRDDSKDRLEKIYAWNKKICEFEDNACKTIAKIRKMYTETVQNEFLLVKTPRNWTFKELWDHLKTWYILYN